MEEVGWPEFAAAAARTESTRSCWPSSRQRSASFEVIREAFPSERFGNAILWLPGRGNLGFMKVAVAFDHRGVKLRERLLAELAALGHDALDLGTDAATPRIDYPDKAREVGDAI